MTTHWTDRLSDFLDGDLSPADRAACEAHLADCEACRDVVNELRLVALIARADFDRSPSSDLWPGILSRLQQTGAADSESSTGHAESAPLAWPASAVLTAPRRRQITFSLPQLALAASLLVAVTAGVSYVAAGRTTNRPAVREIAVQAMAESMEAPSTSTEVTRANFADEQFDRAVSDLEQILVDQRADLDPRTVVVIERNLRVIDEAIQQARAALDADPANTFLNSHLADARRRKLELLRRATTIAGD